MSLSQTQQLKELIGRAERPLVLTRAHWDGDALAATAAMSRALEKLGKRADAACAGFSAQDAPQFSFLPNINAIAPRVSAKTTGVLKLNLNDHEGVESLSYRMDGHALSLFVTPKRGEIRAHHVETVSTEYPYDCIIILGCPDLEQLDALYHDQRNLFFSNPLIVVDHQPDNEHFGTVNVVDLTCSSTSEVVAQLIESIDATLIDRELATTLLTGMVAATKNFTLPNIPPKTFERAGKLVSMGADRELIMRHLYRQKTVPQLKLWGRALQNLRHEADLKLVWSVLSRTDFVDTNTSHEEAEALLDDLLTSAPEAELALLICEVENGKIRHCFRTTKHFPVSALVEKFAPETSGSHRACVFHTAHTNAQQSADEVLAEIRVRLPQLIRR